MSLYRVGTERTHANVGAVRHLKWYQLREAVLDPMTWAFFFYALIADIPNGGEQTAVAYSAFKKLHADRR